MIKAYSIMSGDNDDIKHRWYINRAMQNRVADIIRSKKRRVEHSVCMSTDDMEAAADTSPIKVDALEFICGHDGNYGLSETMIDIQRAMSRLSKSEIDLIYMRLQGGTIEEASEAMGVPTGTIKSRMFRAVRKVADELGQEFVHDAIGRGK